MANRNRKKGKKTVQRPALPWLFYLFFGSLVLILPVFFLSQAMDQTLMPRLLFVSIALLISTPLLFSTKKLLSWQFSVWRAPIFLFIAGFVLYSIFSAFFALNVRETYFDIVRNLLFFAGIAYSAAILQNTRNWPARLSSFFLIAAAIAVIIGLVQYYSRVVLSSDTLLPDGRALVYAVTGLFSHKNFFSSALFLMLPFAGFAVYKLSNKLRFIAVIITMAILVMILILKTRSVWVGLFAGTFVAVMLLLIRPGGVGLSSKMRKWVLVAVLAFIAAFSVLFFAGDSEDDFSFSGRVRSIADVESQHNIHRINIWKGTLEIIKDHPVVGVGPGNWAIHIPLFFGHNFEELSALGWSQPHNDFLWVAAEKGVPGFVFYLSIYIAAIVMLFRVILCVKKDAEKDHKVLALFLLAGLIGYVADSFFSFPYERIDIMVLNMILLGSTIIIHHDVFKNRQPYKPSRRLFLVLLIPVFAFSATFGFLGIRMEKRLGEALEDLNRGNYHSMIDHAGAARNPFRSLGPHLYPPDFLEGVAHQRLQSPESAVAAFERALQQAPNDIRILHLLAKNQIEINQLDEAFGHLNRIADIFFLSEGIIADIKRLSIAYFEVGNPEKTLETLLMIPNWEDDPEVVRNIQIIQQMIESKNVDQ